MRPGSTSQGLKNYVLGRVEKVEYEWNENKNTGNQVDFGAQNP